MALASPVASSFADPASLAPAEEPADTGYEYVSPVPGSRLVSPSNDVVLRPGRHFVAQQLAEIAIEVTGVVSGVHTGRLSLSDDDRTLVFEPDRPFAPGERVDVVAGKTRGVGLGILPPFTFDFFVTPVPPSENAALAIAQSASDVPGFAEALDAAAERASVDEVFEPLPDAAVPQGYPRLSLLGSNAPLPGAVFVSPFSNSIALQPGNLTIVDGNLVPLFFRRLPAPSTDFKRLPDGRLSYFAAASPVTATPQFVVLDSSYAPVDSFAAGNGYVTDSHDLQVLPDGHALLLAYDPEPVRMDSVVAGGRANAVVTGLIVQELDRAKRVVFQWRSWDHFAITDVASPLVSLQSAQIDWVHGNAIEPDRDGDLLLSSRHLCEITRIDRRTGAVIWRMGPHAKQNQFTFLGDARGFSHQHDVRRLANGDLTLFDNGNGVLPEYSRAVEYRLDETNHVATEVWEYRHTPEAFGSFMGNVQRLEDGSTVICWGGVQTGAGLTELHANGAPALEVGMGGRNIWTYRAYVFPWRTTRFRVEPDTLAWGPVAVDGTVIDTFVVANPGPGPLTITGFEITGGSGFFLLDGPPTLAPGASAPVRIAFHPLAPGTSTARLYVVELTADQRVAVPLTLVGTAVHALAARTSPETMAASRAGAPAWTLAARATNPVRGVATVAFTLPREERATLEVFDAGGRRVATLADRVEPAGEHTARWDTRGTAEGIYFCRLTAGGESVVTRLARFQ